MEYLDDRWQIAICHFAVIIVVVVVIVIVVVADTAAATTTATTATIMLVATVVSMWVLSAMAVTVRHGRSRMARWSQQQHNDLQLPPSPPTKPIESTVTTVHLHDPGGGLSRMPLLRSTAGNRQQQYHRDKANQLLRIVESQQQLGGNCTAGTDLNMGEGVVDRYAQVHDSLISLLWCRANPFFYKNRKLISTILYQHFCSILFNKKYYKYF